MRRVRYNFFLKVDSAFGPDLFKEVPDDFDTLEEVWMKLNDSREADFAIRIRAPAICALRRKQDKQGRTALPMDPHLIALLHEVQGNTLCLCQFQGSDAHDHVDVYEGSNYLGTSVDESKKHMSRQRFFQRLHVENK